MQLAAERIELICDESEIYNRVLPLDHKHILELGCGGAEKTRDIAKSGVGRRVTALEVDRIAYEKNLQITELPNVKFMLAGAQDIPLADESVDIVLMFKSLHHVPVELMEASAREIWRVLKPGGLAYLSEPVFAGEFNEILRLFNDEQKVREAAFNTLKKAVDEGLFTLVEEIFFNTQRHYKNFAEFENRIIRATHSNYVLDEALYSQVRQRFEQHLGADGVCFISPNRVDLLKK